MAIVSSVYDKFGCNSNSKQSNTWFSSLTYILSYDTCNTLCTPSSDGGNVNLQDTYPTFFRISNGPIYLGLNFPRTPNLITPLLGDIFKNTCSPSLNSNGYLCVSAQLFCLSCAAWGCSRMILTMSTVYTIISGPKYLLSPTSSQHDGDLYFLQGFKQSHIDIHLKAVIVGELCQMQIIFPRSLGVHHACSQHVF